MSKFRTAKIDVISLRDALSSSRICIMKAFFGNPGGLGVRVDCVLWQHSMHDSRHPCLSMCCFYAVALFGTLSHQTCSVEPQTSFIDTCFLSHELCLFISSFMTWPPSLNKPASKCWLHCLFWQVFWQVRLTDSLIRSLKKSSRKHCQQLCFLELSTLK